MKIFIFFNNFICLLYFVIIIITESSAPMLKTPMTWKPSGHNEQSRVNNSADPFYSSQPWQSQHHILGNLLDNSQQGWGSEKSLWPPGNTSQQGGLTSTRHQTEQPSNVSSSSNQKPGRTSNIAANFSLASNDRTQNKGPRMQWGPENSYPMHPSQPQLLKAQPLSENTEDKTLKAELDWQIWKYQRNVKKMLDRVTLENVDSFETELEQLIADSRLSQNFQGMSEVLVLLQMVVERAVGNSSFGDVAIKLCIVLEGMYQMSSWSVISVYVMQT